MIKDWIYSIATIVLKILGTAHHIIIICLFKRCVEHFMTQFEGTEDVIDRGVLKSTLCNGTVSLVQTAKLMFVSFSSTS